SIGLAPLPCGSGRGVPSAAVQRVSSQRVWANESALVAACAAADPLATAWPVDDAQPLSTPARATSSRLRKIGEVGMVAPYMNNRYCTAPAAGQGAARATVDSHDDAKFEARCSHMRTSAVKW